MISKSAAWMILLALLSTTALAKSDRYEYRYSDDSDGYKKDRRHSDDSDKYRRDRRYSDDSDGYREEKRYKKEHRKEKHLNRGMQKRLERGKGLPPGWQKKLVVGERLDREVYDHGVVVEPLNIRGEITIEVDQRLIRLHKATMEIIDILK